MNRERESLYDALVSACQSYGFTTEATYEALHSAVDSIVDDPEEEAPTFEVTYEIRTGIDGSVVKRATFTIDAADAKHAAEFTHVWVWDNDDACDPRIDPSVHIISTEVVSA